MYNGRVLSNTAHRILNRLVYKRKIIQSVGQYSSLVTKRHQLNIFTQILVSGSKQIYSFNFTTVTMAPTPGVEALVDKMIGENKVMIWSKSYCPFCKKVKEIFDQLNEPYTTYELDLQENGEEIQQVLLAKTSQKTVPNIFVNGKHLGGASDTENALKDGRLKQLLSGDTREFDYDLFVIGGGSGGLACSKEAAQFGMKVAVADFVKPTPIGTKWGLGGTCVNVGCIPKKLMHQAALLGESLSDSRSFGWGTPEEVKHNWGTMVQAIQDHIRSLNWGYKVQLRQQNVKYYNKYASFVDKNTIKLKDASGAEETVTARNVLIATGGRPIYPDIPGAKECCITSDDIFSLSYSPGRTLFCGASYISLECAGFLHGLGYDTTVMVRSILLRGFDQEMANKVGEYMESTGIKFLKQYNLVKFEKLEEGTSGKIRVSYKNADGKIESEVYDTVVLAVGRKPIIDDVLLANAGVSVEEKSGFVFTDEGDRTNVDNIYAIGDVAFNRPELTPVAIQAGRLLARRLFNSGTKKCDYVNVPTTVFTPLEYGACGLSEEDAISKYSQENIEVYHSNFTPLEATIPHRLDNQCYAKIICNKLDQERVVGLHVLGPSAGEVIQGFSIAFKTKATKEHFDDLIGIHPTNAEVLTTMEKTKSSGADPNVTGC